MGASFMYEYVVINSWLQFTPQIYLPTACIHVGEPLVLCHTHILKYVSSPLRLNFTGINYINKYNFSFPSLDNC